jgi:predicted anti-sigma-YlaC factor YlaD
MECINDLDLSRYIDGSPSTKIDQHLKTCPECREVVFETRLFMIQHPELCAELDRAFEALK